MPDVWGRILSKENLRAGLPGWLAVLAAAAAIKLLYRGADNQALWMFLKPVSLAAGFFTGTGFSFDPAAGFYSSGLNVAIDKSCSGVNFFILSFCMLSFSVMGRFKSVRAKAAGTVVSVVAAYLLTLLANSSRIVSSIYLLGAFGAFTGSMGELLHKFTGIAFYLFFLTGAYVLQERLLGRLPGKWKGRLAGPETEGVK